MSDELIKYLQHIGDDCGMEGDDYEDFHIECIGQGEDEDSCPDHKNCGICRYEYMKNKGWLSE